MQTDKINTFLDVGYRQTSKRTVVWDEDNEDVFNYSKRRTYYEVNYKKDENLNLKFWVEYLANFTESEDYLITFEPSIAYVLRDMFSLKTTYNAKYDNEPNIDGNVYTVSTFTTSIIAKF